MKASVAFIMAVLCYMFIALVKLHSCIINKGFLKVTVCVIFLYYFLEFKFLFAVDSISLIRLSWFTSLAPGS